MDTYPANGDELVDSYTNLQDYLQQPHKPGQRYFGPKSTHSARHFRLRVYTYWWSSNTSLEINFPKEASSRYRVTLGSDIEGRYGQKLGKTTTIAWSTAAMSPMVYLHSPGRLATYNAYTDTLTYVTVRNINEVNFWLYRLPLEEDFIQPQR
ncbi:MAG: hypothetical protein U0401_30120 [Anaerolineae bacterium]